MVLLGYYTGHTVELAAGVAFPVYRSFKALKSGQPADSTNAEWLPYW